MNLIMYTLKSMAYIVVEPSLMFMLILIGVIFYIKNRKLVIMQRLIIGESVNSPLELTLSQIVLGIFGGIGVSIILSYLGVMFNKGSGIELIFIISILIMFFKPRFMDFAYSASILGLISIALNYLNQLGKQPKSLFLFDIMSLMTLVAVLHIVEGILTMIDGDKGAIPVFSNKHGKIIGGYALNRYWILPITIFIAYSVSSVDGIGAQSIATPQWWPILNNSNISQMINNMILTLLPMFGAVGYSAVTFTRNKKQKAVSSGIFNVAYGMVLILISQLARYGVVGELVVIIFAPLVYEFSLFLQRKIEDKRKPIFVSGKDGISILDVVPYSMASDLGIKAGDKILTINNKEINTEGDIYSIVKENLNNLTLKIKDKTGVIKELSVRHENNKRLGIVLVPRVVNSNSVVSFENRNLGEVIDKIKENREKNNK